ncbi:MAG: ribokinase [Oscillospiraceae bacterium]|nr:ribokinase [Oscillospiraceae bacterium]
MKVLNFGSVNIDITYRVPHFVRPGETLSARSVTRNAGGKGFNQSVALSRAGCEVYHAGHIGEDGAFLLELCRQYGVRTDYLTQVDVPTGNAVIQVDDDGANCILLYGGANQAMDEAFIREVLSRFDAGDLLVLQNEINCINRLIALAHEAGLKIAINPAPMNDAIAKESLALADWIILNETEARDLIGVEEPFAQLEALKESFPHSSFLLTLGVRGAICQTNGQTCTLGSCKVDAVDTTAAGDTFSGFFLAELVNGKTPEEALLTATRASALAVTRHGAAQSVPAMKEVRSCALTPAPFQR